MNSNRLNLNSNRLNPNGIRLTPFQFQLVNKIQRDVSGVYFQTIYSQLDEIEQSLNYDVSNNGPNASKELLDSQQAERELLQIRKQILYN